jgi:peptidoglycan L-alanyl-D-glutamate endopeptidase CwlK
MASLRLGSTGDMVIQLQKCLNNAGFSCGQPDGNFGDCTRIALQSYQKSKGLLPDGVAGDKTLASFGLIQPSDISTVDHTNFFTVDFVAKLFPVTPKANIAKNLQGVLDGLKFFKLTSAPLILMALGTIRAELESFKPISEMKSKFNTSPNGKPFDLYDNRKDLGNKGTPDGSVYCGRGYIQLTGRDNYIKYGKILGIDLEHKPELANDPKYAGMILAAFIDNVESKIKQDLLEGDLRGARKLVNGGYNGIDRFSDTYIKGIKALPADLVPEYLHHI